MATRPIGIIMNGVTGRMGFNQHLVRSVVAIRKQGGVALPNGDLLYPDPILVGRNEGKLRQIAEQQGVDRWSTDLDACLADARDPIYFDATLIAFAVAGAIAILLLPRAAATPQPASDTSRAAAGAAVTT